MMEEMNPTWHDFMPRWSCCRIYGLPRNLTKVEIVMFGSICFSPTLVMKKFGSICFSPTMVMEKFGPSLNVYIYTLGGCNIASSQHLCEPKKKPIGR